MTGSSPIPLESGGDGNKCCGTAVGCKRNAEGNEGAFYCNAAVAVRPVTEKEPVCNFFRIRFP